MMNRQKLRLPLAFALAGVLAVGSVAAATAKTHAKAARTATPTIPAATVGFGYYPCCADTAVPVVGIQQGFFKDVGITVTPQNGYQWTQASQFLPSMQRGQFQTATAFSTTWLSSLNTFGMNLPPVVLYDIYLGRVIIVSPSSGIKTTADYMKQGMSFIAAAKKAVAGIKGKTVITDPFSGAQPPYYDVLLSYGGMTAKDINFTFLTDDKTLALSATPGRVDIAVPLNAPVLVEMLRSGYKPLIDMASILKYDPKSSQAAELLKETGNQTVMMQRSFLEGSHDTALRFVSAVFRSIAYLTNPKTGPIGDKIVADAINAAQGLKLLPADIATVYQSVDPLFTWEQQPSTLWNPASPYYAPKGLATAVQALIDNKSLPAGTYDLNRFLAAKGVYQQLAALQRKADKLFKQAAKVKGAKASLVAQAHKYYGWYDFLDAVRFLDAALGRS